MVVRFSSVFSLVLTFFFLSACEDKSVERKSLGSRGPSGSEVRDIGPFDGIVALGPTLTTISKGPLSKLELKGPENYLSSVTTRVEEREVAGGARRVLVVELNERIEFPRVELSLTVPDLAYVEANRASQIKMGDFSRQDLTIRADFGGRIELAPAAYGSVDIEVAKVARVVGKEVMVEKAKLRAYGPSLILLGQVAEAVNEAVSPARISYQGRYDSKK